jgi:hypothetical protein
MDIKKLHEKYKDDASPSVELQIRWLKRIGFEPHQIDQAVIMVYSEIERGEKTFKNGSELNLYLKDVANKIRSEEATIYISKLEEFEAKMRKKWDEDLKKQKPWYRRLIG